jgi:hypothetical protein
MSVALQLRHTAPAAPQAVAAVPVWQVPPTEEEQQPPLQAWVLEQLFVQRRLDVSQAVPDGQSAVLVQPQAPATQAWPWELVVQSTHVAPGRPQLEGWVSSAQSAPEQQAPAQGHVGEQLVEHRWVVVLHAEPTGQSVAELQPQVPPPEVDRQRCPSAEPLQSKHATPPFPHAASAVPARH